MSFNGNEGAVVTLADASRWTGNYRNTVPAGDVIGLFLGKNQLMKILNQTGCMGIRFYYAIGDDGVKNLVAVGAMTDESDMTTGVILDKCSLCPPRCGTRNSLNS